MATNTSQYSLKNVYAKARELFGQGQQAVGNALNQSAQGYKIAGNALFNGARQVYNQNLNPNNPNVRRMRNQNMISLKQNAQDPLTSVSRFTPILHSASTMFPQIPNTVESTARFIPDKIGSFVGVKPQDNVVSGLIGGLARGIVSEDPLVTSANRKINANQRYLITPEERKALQMNDAGLFMGATGNITNKAKLPNISAKVGGSDPLEALKAEARKYKSAEEFVKAQTKQDYRSAHQLSLSDSITADKIDIPTLREGIRTRNGYLNNYNLKDLKKLEKLQNNPNAEITIYRASPINQLNDGDWVTTDKTYANDIKRQNGGKVYAYTVKVGDLRFPKDLETLPSLSMASTFSYSPKTSQLTDLWKQSQPTPPTPLEALKAEANVKQTREEFVAKLFKKYNTNSYAELRKKMTDSEYDGMIALRSNKEVSTQSQPTAKPTIGQLQAQVENPLKQAFVQAQNKGDLAGMEAVVRQMEADPKMVADASSHRMFLERAKGRAKVTTNQTNRMVNPQSVSQAQPTKGKVKLSKQGTPQSIQTGTKGVVTSQKDVVQQSRLSSQTQQSQSLQQNKLPSNKTLVQNRASDDIIQQARKEIGSIENNDKKSVGQVWRDTYAQWVNRYDPIERLAGKAKAKLKAQGAELRPEFDPMYTTRRLTGAGGIADQRYQTELKPIIKEIDSLGIDKTDMDVYLKARRDIGLSKRDILGSDAKIAQQRITALEAKYPEIARISQKLYDYQNRGFQEMIDAGFLSKESADLIKQENPDYVPFQRVMDEVDNYLGLPTRKTMQGSQPIQKIKGSERQIISPVESIIANTIKQRAAIEKNNVARSIVGLQEVADLGITKVAQASDDTVTIWKDGKKEYYQVGKEIADVAKGLNEENTNALLKIFQAPAQLLRQGATGRNPDFMIPNIVKDQFDAGITSKYGYIPFVDYTRGLWEIMKKDINTASGIVGDRLNVPLKTNLDTTIYDKWANSGAKIDLGELSGRQAVKEAVNAKTSRKNLFQWLSAGLDLLGRYSEQPTRVGLFNKAYQKTGNETLAMLESRDATVDFARMGSKMKVANSVIPFLNVGVQGFDKIIRSARNNPAKLALNMSIYAALPTVMTTMYNIVNFPEEYAEIPQYEKDANFVLVSGRNDDGTVNYYTIPKGNVLPLVSNPIESFLSYMADTSSQTFNEFATQFISSALPVVGDGSSLKEVGIKTVGSNLPQLVKPVTENLINKSFWKYDQDKEQAKEIVPYYMQDQPAYEQKYEWTPKMYQTIGAVLNVSPLQVQNIMEGYLAGYVKVPSNIIDTMSAVANGESIDTNGIPILRRFIKQTYPTSGYAPKEEYEEPTPSLMERVTGKVDASMGEMSNPFADFFKKKEPQAKPNLVDVKMIESKLEKRPDLATPNEIASYYTRELSFKPSGSKYQDAINEDKVWDRIGELHKRESLTDDQKAQATDVLLEKAGINEADYDYYQIAKGENDIKTMYAIEELSKLMTSGASQDQIVSWLQQNRYTYRGKQVLSSGVIDNLVDEGLLSYEEGKALKKFSFEKDKSGKIKTKKAKTKSKALPKPKKIKLKSVKVPKVKVVSSSGKSYSAPKVKAISIKLKK